MVLKWLGPTLNPTLMNRNISQSHAYNGVRSSSVFSMNILSVQSPGGSVSEIFAKLEVYMWLGLAKYSKEALNNLPDEFLPVYEEEEEEQKKLVPTGLRKLPFSLSCQGK